MIGPADPDARLILRGDGNGGRANFRAHLIIGSVILAIATAWTVLVLSTVPLGPLWITLATMYLPAITLFAQAAAHHKRVRRLLGTELWLSPHGVAYACADGTFGIPWTAVTRIGFRRNATALCIEARGWRGPIAKLGSAWSSTRTLEIALHDTDPVALTQHIHATTGIRLTPLPV